ncbi:hypothetical protein SteCoe_18725 [Stentor coeruleus]|uniref:Uncharacterized protein n=1 Tax=Stentor coeruleus TaxID=5963 RepID=A0A1R2BW06_9CILI|nr:hypothetical protein SteCoe_18725 [Stentor coeruleus]
MLFESKSQKHTIPNKKIEDKAQTYHSPDRKISHTHTQSLQDFYKHWPGLGSSSSPRYRSPTHSALNLENTDTIIPCPTCERRSNETSCQTYHESPPKIRPSHHNVVCEDCSEGSFSKVLKVVCMDESNEIYSGTQKIKIIESVGPIGEPNNFPVVGSGKSVQVHYQEIYPPPKQELTSLIPESKRENGSLSYTLKEEERKRVAIRRAEYANRVKGVAKTIITTITGDSDRDNRIEGQLCSVDEEGLQDDELFNATFGKDPKISTSKIENKKKTSNQYYENLKEDSIKESIENSKKSVKHKILAKLAGKDLDDYVYPGSIGKKNYEIRSVNPIPPINNELVADSDSGNSSRDMPKSPSNTLIEGWKNDSDSIGADKHSTPSVGSRHFDEQKKGEEIFVEEGNDYRKNPNKDKDKEKCYGNVDLERHDCEKNNEKHEFSSRVLTKEDDKNDFMDEDHKKYSPKHLVGENSEDQTGGSIKKQGNEGQTETSHDLYDKNSKDIIQKSFGANENPNDNIKSSAEKASESIENTHEGSDEQFYRTGFGEISKISFVSTDDHHSSGISFDNSENYISKNVINEEDKAQENIYDNDSDKNSGYLHRITESDEDRQETPDIPKDADETYGTSPGEADKKGKGMRGGKGNTGEAVDPNKINMLFLVLTDPQVIKGLKLLGGFADYLEKNGKDVLDWKY